MNMCPFHMSSYNKFVLPFCESHAGFISDFICFLRCDFSRLEGLADLICNHILPGQIPDQPAPYCTDKMKYIFPHPFFLHSWHNRSCLSDTASHSGLYSGAYPYDNWYLTITDLFSCKFSSMP